ncbi:MAG: hypothetical protein H6Q89_5455, partial [Myxococcaceae bacterium]|nr:hypothetical protein [Myxococcaceae bacterium]
SMTHPWRFFRAGGFDQVRLDTGADLQNLAQLDPKLWVALSCPTRGLEFDPHTLELLDTDKDGRIRVPEVIAAAQWTTGLLKNPDELAKGSSALPLESINVATEEGKQVYASAKQLLANLGKGSETSISPADISDTVKIFARTLFNGDGIIPPEAAEADAATAQAIKDVMGCMGTVKDLSGLDGVDGPRIDKFFAEATAFLAWSAGADASADPAGFDAYQAVKSKIDDYFARCALAQMDPGAGKALNPDPAEYVALGNRELSPASKEVASLPVAKIEAGGALPLELGLNPAWAGPIAKFREACVTPLLGKKAVLTFAEWQALGARLAAQETWHATRPAGTVHPLGAARLQELCAAPTRAAIAALMAKDKALEPELKAITSVDKLTHFHRDLAGFVNNFVAFRDFYTHKAKAIFQAGTLYLDGRSCELCVRVDDPARHGALAGASMAYLAYCDLSRKGGPEKMQIVAAFTGGDSDFLMVGRNGVFYDRKGQDWDATITKIVDQPISVRQAFWAPYKRVAKFVEDQISGFAAAKDKEAHDGTTQGIVGTVTTKKEPTGFDIAKFAGVFAAVGLAVGMLASAAAAILTGFLALKLWQMPVAVVAAMLVMSGPSMLLAAMKLRKRVLGPLLDASGWAINARMAINIPFGQSLTHLAVLPPGSKRSVVDPYAQARTPWMSYLVLAAVLGAGFWLWRSGYFVQLVAALRTLNG